MFSKEFEALSREAGIAAAAIGQGINGISNATYAEKGYYHYAFFNLSIAYERMAKLVFILDHLLTHNAYPTDAELRKLGHRLTDLFEKAKEIRERRALSSEQFPEDEVSNAIVLTLSDFATATRYYNLDYLVGGRSISKEEPIAAWNNTVGAAILAKHYRPSTRTRDEAKAKLIGSLMDPVSAVRHTSEDGSAISSWTEGAMATSRIAPLQKYGRMYCLRLVRCLADTLGELQYAAMSAGRDVPFLTDFFRIFHNDDAYFLRRKTWDPYKP